MNETDCCCHVTSSQDVFADTTKHQIFLIQFEKKVKTVLKTMTEWKEVEILKNRRLFLNQYDFRRNEITLFFLKKGDVDGNEEFP